MSTIDRNKVDNLKVKMYGNAKLKRASAAIREYVIEYVSSQTTRFTMQVAEKFGISRQAAHRYIKRLVNEGILTASGETKDRRYALKPIVDESFEIPITFKREIHYRPGTSHRRRNFLYLARL